ncbi:hypothetical protein M9Y10_005259 [Tritrichomonas musculus]|uniref:Uncharacterized protein n=1 Tax=Tritrichomonas musculus TaxID=1915356 RepID=A0ABR2JKY4_9EUKA
MEKNELDILEKQLDSIYKRITKIEKRLKTLRRSTLCRPKIPQYAHSAVFTHPASKKSSPYSFLRNDPQRPQSPLPKTNSGICLVPSPVILILPNDSSYDSDPYSPRDEDPSNIVSLEVLKSLPKDWNQLIQQHNKEIENITFEKVKKVTPEDINLFF